MGRRGKVSAVARVHYGRFTADIEDDFVVFLIGMRVNKPWQVRRWWPVFMAMPPMVRELRADPSKGLLGASGAYLHVPAFIQYWRSFEDLERFARDPDDLHHPAWRRFNNLARASGAVGVWHETYRVRAGEYETIHVNMPEVGLPAATGRVPAHLRGHSAARRIGARAVDEVAVPVD